MRILDLSLHNFGVFRGHQKFDLSPTINPDGTARHLVLIRGQNGVGKSTLFRAMALALYGSRALGERISRKDYSDFLSAALHRTPQNGGSAHSDFGGIGLSFQYVKSGETLEIQVRREWSRSSNGARETLSILCNGRQPEVDPADYQMWLDEFVPQGLEPLCFFDSEQMDAFAAAGETNGFIGGALHRLLGIDLASRLSSDLERYTLTQSGGSKGIERLRTEVLEAQAAQVENNEKLEGLQSEMKALTEQQNAVESDLGVQERLLASEGGTYSARRPMLEERLTTIQKEIEEANAEVHNRMSDLLPFCLAPRLCEALSGRLSRELEMQRLITADLVWEERVAKVREALKKDELWSGIKVSAKSRKGFVDRLVRELSSAPDGTLERRIIHNLAEADHQQLQSWISQTLQTIPEQARTICNKLADLQTEERKTRANLQRVPDENAIAPIHTEILRLESILDGLRTQQAVLGEEMGVVRVQRDQEERKLQTLQEKLRKAQMSERRLALADKSKLALRAYSDALLRQKLSEFEEELVVRFNSICRKEHFLDAVHINRVDFSIQLHRSKNQMLSLSELSAGERQLYALAVLWALRRVSSRQLPLVLDTPLARLDKDHRHRLLFDYFPAVSDQVILFVTDSELNRTLMAESEPFVSRIYRLVYDQGREETIVQDDQRKRARSQAASATSDRPGEKAVAYVS
jgi:DNA sulfur modification protein DndD